MATEKSRYSQNSEVSREIMNVLFLKTFFDPGDAVLIMPVCELL